MLKSTNMLFILQKRAHAYVHITIYDGAPARWNIDSLVLEMKVEYQVPWTHWTGLSHSTCFVSEQVNMISPNISFTLGRLLVMSWAPPWRLLLIRVTLWYSSSMVQINPLKFWRSHLHHLPISFFFYCRQEGGGFKPRPIDDPINIFEKKIKLNWFQIRMWRRWVWCLHRHGVPVDRRGTD